MSTCAHRWQPCWGWSGRYRCEWCGALAYRNVINEGARGKPEQMTVYLCSVKDCGEPAVVHKKRQLCGKHLREREG